MSVHAPLEPEPVLEKTEWTELIGAHYQFQHGAFIAELEDSPPWVKITSDVSTVPMWNHAAWMGRAEGDLNEILNQARASWRWESRRPVVYVVEGSGSLAGSQPNVQPSGFERCDQEAWMVYEPASAPPIDPQEGLEIRQLQTAADLADFIEIFCAAFQAQPRRYGKVFERTSDDPGGICHRQYLAFDGGKAVATGTLISRNGIAGIYNVGTSPAARKRGHAAKLTARLIAAAFALGHRRVFLQAEKGSVAERLYHRLGFRTAFVRTGYRLKNWLPSHERSNLVADACPAPFLETIHSPISSRPSDRKVVLESFPWPPDFARGLQTFARKQGIAERTIWIGAWALLLSRYSHREQACFGLAGSRGARLFPASVSVSEEQGIVDWLREVETQLADSRKDDGMHTNDRCPFDSILWFGPFVDLAVRDVPDGLLELRVEAATQTLQIRYGLGRFEPGAVARLAGHLLTVIGGMMVDGQARLSSLELLTPSERETLLSEWSRSEQSNFEYQPVYRLFEREAARAPEALAVRLAAKRPWLNPEAGLSYGELNRRANLLAEQLRDRGIVAETVVGLFMERSLEMIVGLLAILKAGGVCLPLDPAYPHERVEFILSDAHAAWVLTDPSTHGLLNSSGANRLCVANPSGASAATKRPLNGVENLAWTSAPCDGAYVIYTSGSTGQPKGVLIEHEAIARHCLEARTSYGLTAQDVVLQFNSLAFDAAFEQILGTLMSGATLVLRGPEVWTAQDLGKIIDACGLTILDLPTAYWRQLLQEWVGNPRLLPEHRPRLWLVGGEAMTADAVRLWRQLPFQQVRLLNVYGPTEATITATAFELTAEWLEGELPGRIPIGRPRGARRVYVLDPMGRLVPTGVPGELYIGGPLLARGYLNRPELTREKFVSDPFSQQPGERLYKTGDLVRFIPGGQLEFVGRVDHQVKVRGYRVELGEIEAALKEHPLVRESVVLLREQSGHSSLVGYVVVKNGTPCSVAPFRDFLKRKLPDYMVPSQFIVLRSLPLLPSGKIDRHALLQVSADEALPIVTGPRDPLELRLQLLFERILQRTDIGVDVSFFELGGDSLQALELIVEIERSCGQSLPLEALYQTPTVEALAKRISTPGVTPESSCLVPLQTAGTRPPLYLVHTTPGDVLGYGNLIYHLATDQPCYGFQSLGLFQPEMSHRRIEDMAEHYVTLLRSFQPAGPYYLAGWCYGGLVAVEMAQRLLALEEEVAFLGLLETVAPAPSLAVYPYYLHRLRCFLRMHPWDWLRYFQSKWMYHREVRLANRMRFRRLEQTQSGDTAGLEEQNCRLAKLEHVYTTNLTALRLYQPRPYPGRVTLFNAEQIDPGVIPDPLYAWKGLASSIDLHAVPGDHDTMLTEPNVAVLARKLDHCLRRAQDQAAARHTIRPVPRSYALAESPRV